MAFALLLAKANKIDDELAVLQEEKQDSIKIHAGGKPGFNISKKLHHCQADCKRKLKKCCNKMFSFPENSWLHKTCVSMRHDGTIENYIFKSAIGFISGFALIYIFFLFFVIILKFNLGVATFMCTVIGCILTIGLAFSPTVRCIVLLILPQFFSKRGRQALIAYAFILTITGPARNTLNNMGIMSESLACGQEQLKQAVREIMEVIKKPFIAIKEAVKKVVKVVKVIVKKVKEIFLAIKRIVMGIVRVIKAAFKFLGKIFNICSKKVGTPFQRCQKVFEGAVTDCYAQMGPMFDWLCSIVYVTKAVCYIVKPLEFICILIDFISESFIGVIIRKIKTFIRHIRSTFYVRIRFSHSFAFKTTHSKSMKEVTDSIIGEIRQRCKKVLEAFDFISSATSFFFLIVILRAMLYRYKFLTAERFDNTYITKNFRQIDFRRAQMEKDTVLPLNRREKNKYVDLSSIRLIKIERKKLAKSLTFLTSVTFKVGIHMAADYSLYWVLATIRYYGKYKSSVQAPNMVGLHIEGKGILAGLYKSIANAFKPLGAKMNIDTVPCLPDPIPPNYDTYIQIGFVLFLCWILAIFEPYGLRLRSYVMCYYHPARARERSVWLYNHILRNRGGFLKFARRLLKRKFFGQKGDTKVTCKEYLRASLNCKICRICLGNDKQESCVLCAEVFRPNDPEKPIRCSTPGCPGLYCKPCFDELKNLCTICLEPIQYGDLSDVDEEKDSSEDEASSKFKRRSKHYESTIVDDTTTKGHSKISSLQIKKSMEYVDLLPEISKMQQSNYSKIRSGTTDHLEDTSPDLQKRRNTGIEDLLLVPPKIQGSDFSDFSQYYKYTTEDTSNFSIDASANFQTKRNKSNQDLHPKLARMHAFEFSKISPTKTSTLVSSTDHTTDITSNFPIRRNVGANKKRSRIQASDYSKLSQTQANTIPESTSTSDLSIDSSNLQLKRVKGFKDQHLKSTSFTVKMKDVSDDVKNQRDKTFYKTQDKHAIEETSMSTIRSNNSSFNYQLEKEPGYIDLLSESTLIQEQARSKYIRGRGGQDSDYNSDFTDSDSTEYSTSYQYSASKPDERPIRFQFRDIERQHIPDYTAMEIFRDDNPRIEIREGPNIFGIEEIRMKSMHIKDLNGNKHKEDQCMYRKEDFHLEKTTGEEDIVIQMMKMEEYDTKRGMKDDLRNRDLKQNKFRKIKSSSDNSSTSSSSSDNSNYRAPIIKRKVHSPIFKQSGNLAKQKIIPWLKDTLKFGKYQQVVETEDLLIDEFPTEDSKKNSTKIKEIPKKKQWNKLNQEHKETKHDFINVETLLNNKRKDDYRYYSGPKIQTRDELVPLLNLQNMYSNDSSSSPSETEEKSFLDIKNLTKPELATNFQDLTTATSSNTYNQNPTIEYNSVPITFFFDPSTGRTETTRLNHLFQDLKYEEINETPRSSQDWSSSTRTARSGDDSMEIRRRRNLSESSSSISLSDFSKFNKKYEAKVKKYYKELKQKPVDVIREEQKKFEYFNFFKRLFR